MNNAETSPSSGQPTPSAASKQTDSTVDVQKLADKVYRLMLAELRLERARGTQLARRKES